MDTTPCQAEDRDFWPGEVLGIWPGYVFVNLGAGDCIYDRDIYLYVQASSSKKQSANQRTLVGAEKALKNRVAPPWKVFSEEETYVIVGSKKKKGSTSNVQDARIRLHSRAPRLISETDAENAEMSE